MNDSIFHARKSNCSEEEDNKDDVGIDGGDPDDFGILRYSLNHAGVNEYPRCKESKSNFVIEAVQGFNIGRNVERLAIPEILRWTAGLVGKVF